MIKNWIYEWFAKNSGVKKDELNLYENKNYLTEGLIDSFGFLSLISACEEELSMEFLDDDFSDDDIFTINGLAKIIAEKQPDNKKF